jgi:hypothetical protein
MHRGFPRSPLLRDEVLLSFDLPVDLREARFWMAKQIPQVATHTNLALIFF